MITGSNDEMTTESQLRGMFDSLPMQEKVSVYSNPLSLLGTDLCIHAIDFS